MLGGRLGLSPIMIGRQPALGRLRRLAAAPEFALVLLNGEAGIGKTRLLRELTSNSERQVLAGQADPTGLSRPLGLVSDLLGVTVADPTDPSEALTMLEARLAGAPSIVVFEDLHWADAGSVEVFERLADRRLPGMLLIGTYRPEDLSRRLPGGDVLARLERRHDIERLHLDRLDRAEVAAFLATVYQRPLPSGVADAMYERTGGNPFFLEELAAACHELPPDHLVDQPLPWSLEDVVRRQLDGLTAEQRRLAEAAAILGPSATFDVLAGVAELDEAALVTRLRALVDSGILVEPSDDHFVFRHALVRDAVEKHLLGRERRRLHERALELISLTDCPSRAELARHAAGAGRYEEMVEHAREAAVLELRQRGTSHLALRLASDALTEAPDDPVLLEVATEAAWLLGLLDESLVTALRLLEVATASGSMSCTATARRWLARLYFDRDEDELVTDQLVALERLLDEALEPIDRARTLAALAQATMLRSETEAAIAWADRAIAEADAIGAADVVAQAMIERGSAMVVSQLDGAPELEQAIDLAERLGLWVLVTRGLNNLFDATQVHTAQGQALLERFRQAADRAGFDSMNSVVYFVRLVDLGFGLGDASMVREAMARAQERMPLHRYKESDWVETRRLQLDLEHGQTTGLYERLGELGGARCVHPDDHRFWVTALGLAAASMDGDLVRAREFVDELRPLPSPSDPGVVVDAVEAALTVGISEGDIRRSVLDPIGPRMAPALPIAQALLDQSAHRHGEAAAILRHELEHPAASFTVPVLGRLHTLLAVSELALGRREAAAVAAAEADRLLARWPGWRRSRLADVQRRLAATAIVHDSVQDLTARERDVVALLAEGLSNGQIAQRLFISPKTASVHVSNILLKLGMSNRTEIAAWAVRQGLAGTG